MKNYSRKYGVIFLLFTICCSLLFIYWIFTPLPADKAFVLESQGHQDLILKKYSESYEDFVSSAALDDDDILKGKRYGYAATAAYYAGRYTDSYYASLQSLHYLKGNKTAEDYLSKILMEGRIPPHKFLKFPKNINGKEELFSFSSILYLNRFTDGWSRGKTGGAVLLAGKNCKGILTIFTSNPSTAQGRVFYTINSNIKIWIHLEGWKPEHLSLPLHEGVNVIKITTDKTFIPKHYGINDDTRELGVNFSIDVTCNE